MIAMDSRLRRAALAFAAMQLIACAPDEAAERADTPAATAPSPAAESPRQAAAVPATWDADTAEIRRLTKASSDAWNRGDLKEHLAFYVDTVTFMTANGPRPGVAAVEKSFTEKYFRNGKPKQTLSFSQVTIRPLGRDAALETGRFQLSGGGEAEQSGWFTLVWMRTADGWRAVHDHSS